MSTSVLRYARLPRFAAVTLLALAAGSCAAPDDVSDQYRVDLQLGSNLVYRGEGTYARAILLHIVGTDTTEVPNAVFTWEPNGPVEIQSYPDGYANIDGIARGTAYVYVFAAAYGGDDGDEEQVRVADQVELDTVTPDTVAWGGRLTLYGVRVGNPNDVSVKLNGVTLIPDTLSLTGEPDQVQTMSYFVPGGAGSGILQLTGFGLLATDSTPITVLGHELYEPNGTAPTVLGLDTLQPYPARDDPPTPGHPEIRFFDPALLYEAPAPGDSTVDWYRFTSTTESGGPWTFVFRSPAIPLRGAFGVPATLQSGVPVFGAGAYGFDFDNHKLLSRCRGTRFEFPERSGFPSDSIVLSVQSLPPGGMDFVELTKDAGAYTLGVYAGFRAPPNPVSTNAITPDRFEDNDFCEQADANFLVGGLAIDLGLAAFSDTLTIDTPNEIDWIRFHVASPGNLAIRTAPRSGFPDAALSLYLYKQSDLSPVDSTTGGAGSDETLTRGISAGDYYLVVVNTDGTPTRYGLCIAEGASCTEPPEPSGPRPGARRR